VVEHDREVQWFFVRHATGRFRWGRWGHWQAV
jgi:hypothetical protein